MREHLFYLIYSAMKYSSALALAAIFITPITLPAYSIEKLQIKTSTFSSGTHQGPYDPAKDLGISGAIDLGLTLGGLGGIKLGGKFVKGVGEKLGGQTKLEKDVPNKLYHYTRNANIDGILKKGLVIPKSGKIFATPNGNLSPLQA